MDIEKLLTQAKEELDRLDPQEFENFANGFDNRGIECVTQRWYLPDSLREGAIAQLAAVTRRFEDVLRDKYETFDWN